MEFNVIDEENKFKLGETISIFKIPNNSREFVLFSISDFDKDEGNLQVAYLNKDSQGYDYISEIEDEKTLKKAMKVVKDMIGGIQ